jgi:hypothetical protein
VKNLRGTIYIRFKKSHHPWQWFLPNWSGREDSNLRPLQPHCSALPDCATPRHDCVPLMVSIETRDFTLLTGSVIARNCQGAYLTFENVEYLFQFHANLADDLLAAINIIAGPVAFEHLTGSANGVALFV